MQGPQRLTAFEAHDVRRRAEIHRRNLTEIRRGAETYRKYCTLDISPPRGLNKGHKRARAVKKQQAASLRQREIHRENLRIMERMAYILRQDGGRLANKQDCYRQAESGAVAKATREKARRSVARSIRKENQLFKQRLARTQPVYSAKQWKEDFKANSQYVSQLSYYANTGSTGSGPKRPKNRSGPSSKGRGGPNHCGRRLICAEVVGKGSDPEIGKLDDAAYEQALLSPSQAYPCPSLLQESFDGQDAGFAQGDGAVSLGVQPDTDDSCDLHQATEILEIGSLDTLANGSTLEQGKSSLAKDILCAIRGEGTPKSTVAKRKNSIRSMRGRAKMSTKLPMRVVYKRAVILNGRRSFVRLVWIGGERKEIEAFFFDPVTHKTKSYVLHSHQVKQVAKFYARSQSKGNVQAILRFCLEKLEQRIEGISGCNNGPQYILAVRLKGPITSATATKMAADPEFAAQVDARVPRIELKPFQRIQMIYRTINKNEASESERASRPSRDYSARISAKLRIALKNDKIELAHGSNVRIEWSDERLALAVVRDTCKESPKSAQAIAKIDLGHTIALDPTAQEREADEILRCAAIVLFT